LEWDEAKNRANIRKHGFDFEDAEEMFNGPSLVRPDTRDDYGEERWIGIGLTKSRLALVAFTERPDGAIRIISLRADNRRERKEYEEAIQNGLGAY
jgi:uncharacterized DUF497 family protein